MHILLQHLAVPNLSIFEGYWQKMISLREFRINICIHICIYKESSAYNFNCKL